MWYIIALTHEKIASLAIELHCTWLNSDSVNLKFSCYTTWSYVKFIVWGFWVIVKHERYITMFRPVHTAHSTCIQSGSMHIYSVHTKNGSVQTGLKLACFQSTSGGGFNPVRSGFAPAVTQYIHYLYVDKCSCVNKDIKWHKDGHLDARPNQGSCENIRARECPWWTRRSDKKLNNLWKNHHFRWHGSNCNGDAMVMW